MILMCFIRIDRFFEDVSYCFIRGKSIVEQLSRDLQKEFSGIEGFSTRNLWDMR